MFFVPQKTVEGDYLNTCVWPQVGACWDFELKNTSSRLKKTIDECLHCKNYKVEWVLRLDYTVEVYNF